MAVELAYVLASSAWQWHVGTLYTLVIDLCGAVDGKLDSETSGDFFDNVHVTVRSCRGGV